MDLDVYAKQVPLNGLSADEEARARRMAFARDTCRSLASRHALRAVLAGIVGRSPASLVIEPDVAGKPHLASGQALHFNVSHSAHRCLIGVSAREAIGVDIEVMRSVEDAQSLARSYFTRDEREECSTDAAPGSIAFLSCWTRKEACMKALGVGLAAQPATIDVGCAPRIRSVSVPLGVDRCAVTVYPVDIPCDAIAAVALAAPADAIRALAFFRPA